MKRVSQVECHSAHVEFRARVQYAWHPSCGQEVEVQYREMRRGEQVFVSRVADGTSQVIPAWMFDAGICSRLGLGVPRVDVGALQDL